MTGENMKKTNKFNILLYKDSENVCIANSKKVKEVAYNDNKYAVLYYIDEGVARVFDGNCIEEDDAEWLFTRYEKYDKECGRKEISAKNIYGEIEYFAKLDWHDMDHHTIVESFCPYTGMSLEADGWDIIEGVCYESDFCQEFDDMYIDYFKFISVDGKEFYLKYVQDHEERCSYYMMSSEEEFKKYDN